MESPPMGSIKAHPAAAEDDNKHLYDILFMGMETITTFTTTVTKHPDAVTEWINGVDVGANTVTVAGNRFLPVGFALEFDNTTSRGPGRIGTVQLYVGNRCLVIQLPDGSACAPSLNEFLGNPDNYFLGVYMHQKVEVLKQQFPSITAEIVYVELAPDFVVEHADKEKILASVAFNDVVETDWARHDNLSLKQVHYASLDAFLNHSAAFQAPLELLIDSPASSSHTLPSARSDTVSSCAFINFLLTFFSICFKPCFPEVDRN